jgi:hypothetical protein
MAPSPDAREPPMQSRIREARSRSGSVPGWPAFTRNHRQLLQRCWQEVHQAEAWHPALPVLLLDRCWLRLERVDVQHLEGHLPLDLSQEAPELVRFRQLIRGGFDPWGAQLACWLEFGEEACQQAQTNAWQQAERSPAGWALERYLGLITDYRRRFGLPGPASLPLIVRPRVGDTAPPDLIWLTDGPGRCATLAADCWLADGRRFHPGDFPDDSSGDG